MKEIYITEGPFKGCSFDEMTQEELEDWLYGDGADDDDAWVASMTDQLH